MPQLVPESGPLRVKPHQGRPRCVLEVALQYLWRHRGILYLCAVVTLTLLAVVFNIHVKAGD